MLTVGLATADVIGRGKVGLGHVSVEGLLLDSSLFNDLTLSKSLRYDLFLRHNVVLHMLLFIFLFFAVVVFLLLLLLHRFLRLIFLVLWLLFLLLGRQEVVDGDKDECH